MLCYSRASWAVQRLRWNGAGRHVVRVLQKCSARQRKDANKLVAVNPKFLGYRELAHNL